MQPYYCKNYFAQHTDFEEGVKTILNQIENKDCVVRLVFFGLSSSNENYLDELKIVKEWVKERYQSNPPVVSFVVQPVLGEYNLAAEVHFMREERVTRVVNKEYANNNYLIVETEELRLLMLGGVMAHDINLSIGAQSKMIFDTIEAILDIEQIPIRHIVRQWNYIEQITRMEGDIQHYQAFNDARSLFYLKEQWEQSGYPAATGIGTKLGGVMVDLIAMIPSNDTSIQIVAVDNPLQVPAHDYSQEVLLGDKNKELICRSTPKFERAKVVGNPLHDSICFVSGTAAIRGEMSIAEMDIREQAVITMENIAHLISCNNLKLSGFDTQSFHKPGNLRIYLKHETDYFEAMETIMELTDCTEQIYLMADVCREELLIEIEGITTTSGR